MRYRRLIGTAMLAAAFLALPSMEAWGQKDKKKDGPAAGAPKEGEDLPAGEYIGILKSTPGTDRSFTVDLETTRLVPTGKGGGRPGAGSGGGAQRVLQIQMQMQQAQAQAAAARTPQARQQAMGRLSSLAGQLRGAIAGLQRSAGKGGGAPAGFRYEKSHVLVEFQASEKAKVRTLVLPDTFDDKGTLRKYTPKELEDLKGKDRSSPGYESALEKLEVGQMIKVTTAAVAKGATKVDKDKDDDEQSKQAKMIVVLKAADPALAKGDKKKKK
jgi:hypothetical protein